jgi:hypothetical protein
LLLDNLFQNGSCLELIGMGLIVGGCGGIQSQGIEHPRFGIVAITAGELLHRFLSFLIGEGPRPVVEPVGILVQHLDGGDVVPLSVGFAAQRDGPFNAPSFMSWRWRASTR